MPALLTERPGSPRPSNVSEVAETDPAGGNRVTLSESPGNLETRASVRPRKRSIPWMNLVIAILVLALSVVSVLNLRPHRPSEAPVRAVPSSAGLGKQPQADVVAGVGLIESSTENIALSVPVAGCVIEALAHAGDAIHKGEALFKLDDRDLQAELAVRKAQVVQSRAHLATAESDLADALLLESDASRLQQQRVISEEEGKRKRISAEGARARVEEAKTQIALNEAQVHETEVNIERLIVTSPIGGVILQSDVRPGQYASVGPLAKPLMILGKIDPLHVRVDIDEQEAWRVTADAPATASPRGNSEQRVQLQFVRFEPYILPKQSLTGDSSERVDTRVLQAIYRIAPVNTNAPLFVGQQVDVFIEGRVRGATGS